MSAYVLGALADPRAIPPLQAHLTDDSPEVTWNSAIALTRMNDPSGSDILLKLLDRQYLNGFPQITEDRKKEVMIEAIKAAHKLKDPALDERIRKLSTSDPSPGVRDAALKALQ
jgi:HEAT repeat protein